MSTLLECRDLSHTFGDRRLFSGLGFQLRSGDFLVVTGESGSGKSTLLSLLTKEVPCQAGVVIHHGSFAEISQSLGLCHGLSCEVSIATGRLREHHWLQTLWGVPASDLAKARELAGILELHGVLGQDVAQLSGGERQRTAVARALLQPAKIIIADEPVSMLDRERSLKVMGELKKFTSAGGAVICSLHQNELIKTFATHILEISEQKTLGWSYQVCDKGPR